MSKPRLIYFDAPVSRGEECRIALTVAGVDFEDVRIKSAEWPQFKAQTPYGAVPVLELPDRPPLAHTNAILTLIGRRHGLHPTDDFEAAQHEAMMQHVEDLRANVGPTIFISDPDEKKKAREKVAAEFLPAWGAAADKNIPGSPFFAGEKLNVVDIKLYMAVRWFVGGKVDHIPGTIFDAYPKLMRVHNAVRDHPRVKAWNEKQ